jgi:thiosulfate/3-mercaptopyruvate sulfurtransferase
MRSTITISLLLAAFTVSALGQTKPAHPEMLVSTEWLAAHLNDPKLVILEFPKEKEDYATGHVPGARAIWGEQIYGKKNGVESELLPVDQLVKTFEELGVSDDSHVVIYTTDWPPMAPRVYFTLDYLGLGDHASLLDGGQEKWKAEKRSLSKETPAVTKGHITPHVRPEIVASAQDVKAASASDGNTVVVDARPDRRYTAGHIPGAVHLYWQKTVGTDEKQNQYLPHEEIQKAYLAAGAPSGRKLITYCEIGWQASHDYFTAKYLGYDVKMYDGSYQEWKDVKHEAVVTGDKPR